MAFLRVHFLHFAEDFANLPGVGSGRREVHRNRGGAECKGRGETAADASHAMEFEETDASQTRPQPFLPGASLFDTQPDVHSVWSAPACEGHALHHPSIQANHPSIR
eukprot:gene25178-biopygen8999